MAARASQKEGRSIGTNSSRAAKWAPMGTEPAHDARHEVDEDLPLDAENPAEAGHSCEAAEGTRTLDLLHGKQTL